MFDCAFKPRNGIAVDRLAGPRADDGGRPAVPVGSDLARRSTCRARSTPADIADAYLEGWRLGLKALADLSRRLEGEPAAVDTSSEGDKAAAKQVAAPRRERLPDTRHSITHKFNVAGHEGYITVGLYDDGRPGELFITMAKEGSTIGGLMDCFGTAVSMSLQYGVPLEVYVNKFSHTRFEPMGHTKNPDIRIAKSIVDYIFRWLGITFLPGYREANLRHCRPRRPAQGGGEDDAEAAPARRQEGRRADGGPGSAKKTAAEPTASSRTGRRRRPSRRRSRRPTATPTANGTPMASHAKPAPTARSLERAGVAMKLDLNGGSSPARSRAVRQLPDRRPELRQLRRDHRPQRQLLPVPQLRQQHGLLVTNVDRFLRKLAESEAGAARWPAAPACFVTAGRRRCTAFRR